MILSDLKKEFFYQIIMRRLTFIKKISYSRKGIIIPDISIVPE